MHYICNMKTLAERLVWARNQKSARDKEDLSQAGLARLAGVSQGTIGNLESGLRRTARKIASIADALDVNVLWLAEGKGVPFEGSNVIDVEARFITDSRRAVDLPIQKLEGIEIPQYSGIGGSMGAGVLLRDQPGEIYGWRVGAEWITKNVKTHTGAHNLRIVTGFGDSMRPLFNPGDPLLVDAGVTDVEFDSIYFFRIGDEGFIKRLQRVPGHGLVAISENKSYRDWVITADMDFEVFARVVKVWCGSDF